MKILIYTLLILIVTGLKAQNYSKQFDELLNKTDTIGQSQLLAEWCQHDPTDAELYIAYFNHYTQRSMHEVAVANSFIYSDIRYSKTFMDSAFMYIRKGIALYPNRLDLRFGEIHMLGEIENFELQADKIIETISHSAINNNNWLWKQDEKIEGGKEVLLSSIQDYQITIFNTNNDSIRNYALEIANGILEYYPDHVESLCNAAVVYSYQKDYDKSLKYLKKALTIDPEDNIIILNLAGLYREMEDYDKSILYYKRSLKFGNEESNNRARKAINEMSKIQNE